MRHIFVFTLKPISKVAGPTTLKIIAWTVEEAQESLTADEIARIIDVKQI